MKMSHEEITAWCYERVLMNHRLMFNTEGHYMMRYENGETYEWKSVDENGLDHVMIYINGELVSNCLYKATWLENGNFGNKLIEELPIIEEKVG